MTKKVTEASEKVTKKSQDRILAVWILAAKLPNSDLNFAVDFLVDFFLLFFPRKKARKNPPKNPPQNSPGTSFGKIPLGFLQKPSLEKEAERVPKTKKSDRTPFANLLLRHPDDSLRYLKDEGYPIAL